MSLALGSISTVSTDGKRKWEPLLARWHTQHPHGGVHSASGWALRSWGLSPPPIKPEDIAGKGHNWQVTPTGLTLIRIPAGQVERPESREAGEPRKTIGVDREFWLSDREITAGEFLTFLDDPAAEKPADADEIRQSNTGDPARPAAGVNWYDAVLFCNWLSGREGREPCYRPAGKEQIKQHDGTTREYAAWQLIPAANGYRLPTEYEWEYACRDQTTTAFSFGDDEDLLERYAVFAWNERGSGPNQVGSKLCNAWGLFDMHGNVWEWCQDWFQEGVNRVLRGGQWSIPATCCQSAFRSGHQPSFRFVSLGLRVATAPPRE